MKTKDEATNQEGRKMIRRKDQETFAERLATIVEAEEVRYALMMGDLKVRCDHAKKKFWFSKCPDHLWDAAESSVIKATGYKPVDADD